MRLLIRRNAKGELASEMHVYSGGARGLGVWKFGVTAEGWNGGCLQWMVQLGVIVRRDEL